MPKVAANTPQGSGRQVWVPKGSKEDLEGDVAEEEEPVTAPLLLEPSTGHRYTRQKMLSLYDLYKQELQGGEAMGQQMSLAERPAEDADATTTPGARRSLRDAKKAEKFAKRMGSTDPLDNGTPGHRDSMAMAEMSSLGTFAGMTPAMMHYLNSMAFAGPPMPPPMYAPPVYTTVMLRHIPNRYTRDMLVSRLNKGYKGQFDLVYLPIDFNSKCNIGYAFINFRSHTTAQMFMQEFHGAKAMHVLPGFSSTKVCQVSYARVQGREANMENLRDEGFLEKITERSEWQPLFYDDDANEIPFKVAKKHMTGKSTASRASAAAPGKEDRNLMEKAAWYPLLFAPDGEPLPFPLLSAPSGGGGGKAPSTPSSLRPVPARAVDARSLETKMQAEATAPSFGREQAGSSDAAPDSPEKSSPPEKLKAAAKPKAAGNKTKAPAPRASMGAGGMDYPNYPGYPPYGWPGAYHPYYQAYYQQATAMQHAHATAAAMAAAQTGPYVAGALLRSGKPNKAQQVLGLKEQIEFYFSTNNLCKDVYLRSHMDTSGWTPIDLIAQFPKVTKHKASVAEIGLALEQSNVLEVDLATRSLRLHDPEARSKWAHVPANLVMASSPQAKVSVDRPS